MCAPMEHSFGPLMLSTVFVEFLAGTTTPRMHPCSRAVRRAVSGLGQCACARTVVLLVRTASCDARHGDVQSWGREEVAAAVAAARAGSQTRYRGGGSGAAPPGPLPPPLPLPPPPPAVVPEESETCGEAATSSG